MALTSLPCRAAGTADTPEVASLLMQARWIMEPSHLMARAAELLDAKLDQDPNDRNAWMQLGEVLDIGIAHSRHAAIPADAWHQAYLLDRTNCHAGALAARYAGQDRRTQWTLELAQEQKRCPEALYLLSSLSQNTGAVQIQLLRDSLAIRSSADAEIALAQALLQEGEMREAKERFVAAKTSPPLFPEDWRPDGRIAVHIHLGLAWLNFSSGKMAAAKRDYQVFLRWFLDPGPWHDLSATETHWRDKLEARFPGLTTHQR